jgi:hypothetical protein
MQVLCFEYCGRCVEYGESYVERTSLPLVLTNGIMNSDKRASAQIRLHNLAKAKTFQFFLPLVKTNGHEYSLFLDSY